ncbi:MAG TPA: hypothetical protein VKC66_34395 [Xanthobacteraceae bacterium]|nr:hypothetical protein [Xanthobacteraceae bacterium]
MLVIHNSFVPLSRVWVSALFKIKDFALLWVGGLRSLVVLFPLTPIAPARSDLSRPEVKQRSLSV